MRSPEKIIKRPLLTEKGSLLKETGGRPEKDIDPEQVEPQLLLEVSRDANKIEIKHAVEKLWNVNVLKVRTSIVRGKQRRVGRHIGRRSNWKRALVTLAAGQKIDFFEGV
ncbi:MAG: 50S ribosomal protein L23 [Polyangia bacterium]